MPNAEPNYMQQHLQDLLKFQLAVDSGDGTDSSTSSATISGASAVAGAMARDATRAGLRAQQARHAFDSLMISVVSASSADTEEEKEKTRFTISVPKDNTILSLGRATKLDDKYQTTDGITGRSDRHIHWDAGGPARTTVSLGAGARSTTLVSDGPGLRDPDSAKGPPLVAAVPGASSGYSMLTEGSAWQESTGRFSVVSDEGEVVLRSMAAESAKSFVVLQADNGDVDIAGGNAVRIGTKRSIGIVALEANEFSRPNHREPIKRSLQESFVNDAGKFLLKVADIVRAGYGVFANPAKQAQGPTSKSPSWSKADHAITIKKMVDITKLASTVGRWAGPHVFQAKSPGVSIVGDTVSASGRMEASMYGSMSATLSSGLSASVLGGTASVNGLGYASVWSFGGTSIKSLGGKTSVESESDSVSVRGWKKAELSSFKGPTLVRGRQFTQVDSDGPVFVHSPTKAYFAGAGMGLCSADSEVIIGTFLTPDDYDEAELDDERPHLAVTPTSTFVSAGVDAEIRLHKNGTIAIQGKQAFSVKSDGGVMVETTKKILFD